MVDSISLHIGYNYSVIIDCVMRMLLVQRIKPERIYNHEIRNEKLGE